VVKEFKKLCNFYEDDFWEEVKQGDGLAELYLSLSV
jgi:hypothetical protein